jgi:hypothetical protein
VAYDNDVLTGNWRKRREIPVVVAEIDVVVEDATGSFCGAVVSCEKSLVTLEDRKGRRRTFALQPAGFLLDGKPVTLVPPESVAKPAVARKTLQRTASGSIAVAGVKARVARASRIWVEGVHDAALVERVWGDDLRIEGIVVEPLGGIDDLVAHVRDFGPGRTRRVGVLVDHLVPGSKESRIVAGVSDPNVLVTGHPYVDVWQAVKPSAIGIAAWPTVARSLPWKEGVAQALGFSDPAVLWRRVLASVNSFADVEVPLLRSVEQLIDFVTAPGMN